MLKEIKLAVFFRNAERFASSGSDDADPRFVLLYAFTSFLLINLSSFSLELMLAVIAISMAYSLATKNLRRVRSSMIIAVPFITFFSFSSLILTSNYLNVVKASVFLIAIISLGSLMLNLEFDSLISCLSSLKVPKKIRIALLISVRMLNLFSRDFASIIEIHAINEERRLEFYRKILRAGVSVMMLRAISLAENLYLRDTLSDPDFLHSDPSKKQRLGAKEIYFVLSSACILLLYAFLKSKF